MLALHRRSFPVTKPDMSPLVPGKFPIRVLIPSGATGAARAFVQNRYVLGDVWLSLLARRDGYDICEVEPPTIWLVGWCAVFPARAVESQLGCTTFMLACSTFVFDGGSLDVVWVSGITQLKSEGKSSIRSEDSEKTGLVQLSRVLRLPPHWEELVFGFVDCSIWVIICSGNWVGVLPSACWSSELAFLMTASWFVEISNKLNGLDNSMQMLCGDSLFAQSMSEGIGWLLGPCAVPIGSVGGIANAWGVVSSLVDVSISGKCSVLCADATFEGRGCPSLTGVHPLLLVEADWLLVDDPNGWRYCRHSPTNRSITSSLSRPTSKSRTFELTFAVRSAALCREGSSRESGCVPFPRKSTVHDWSARVRVVHAGKLWGKTGPKLLSRVCLLCKLQSVPACRSENVRLSTTPGCSTSIVFCPKSKLPPLSYGGWFWGFGSRCVIRAPVLCRSCEWRPRPSCSPPSG